MANMNKLMRRQKGIQKARRVLRVWRAVNHRDLMQADYYADGGLCEQGLYKTRSACSCYMCGNPRKLGERTRQEILSDLEMKNALQDEGRFSFAHRKRGKVGNKKGRSFRPAF
jgi:hypothetical protein